MQLCSCRVFNALPRHLVQVSFGVRALVPTHKPTRQENPREKPIVRRLGNYGGLAATVPVETYTHLLIAVQRRAYTCWCLSNGVDWIFGILRSEDEGESFIYNYVTLPSLDMESGQLEDDVRMVSELLIQWVSRCLPAEPEGYSFLTVSTLDLRREGRCFEDP